MSWSCEECISLSGIYFPFCMASMSLFNWTTLPQFFMGTTKEAPNPACNQVDLENHAVPVLFGLTQTWLDRGHSVCNVKLYVAAILAWVLLSNGTFPASSLYIWTSNSGPAGIVRGTEALKLCCRSHISLLQSW